MCGAVYTSNFMFGKFWEAAKVVEPEVENRLAREEIRLEYTEFLRRLEDLSDKERNLGLSSMDLLCKFFHPDESIALNIESLMSVLESAAVVMSVEAVVEGWISVLENHSSKTRGLGQVSLEDEVTIAINGPELTNCDSVVSEACVMYWGQHKDPENRGGHYIRRSEKIKSYFVSKSIDTLRSQQSKTNFMS